MLTRKVTAVIQQGKDSGRCVCGGAIQNKMARELGLSGVKVETSRDHSSSLGAVIIGTGPCVVINTVCIDRDADDRNHCSLFQNFLRRGRTSLLLDFFIFRFFCWHFEVGFRSVAQDGLQIA